MFPREKCVELKSLKLYLWSFRDEGAFHEAVTNRILDDLVAALAPRRLRVEGDFMVRGGIHTVVVAEHQSRVDSVPSSPIERATACPLAESSRRSSAPPTSARSSACARASSASTRSSRKWKALSDAELRGKTAEFKQKLDNGATLDDILEEAFATVREASRRVARHAPLRRAAHRRHGAAPRRHRRDEDRRGQDAGRHLRRST